MMRTNTYIEWYNDNEGRSYPIAETASKVTDDGRVLPDDIVVDAGILAPPAHAQAFISSIRISPAIVSVGISSSTSGLLVGSFARNSIAPLTAYSLTGCIDDVTGWIVFGNRITEGVEDYRFSTAEQSALEQRAVRIVDPLPVEKFLKLNGRPGTFAEKVVLLQAGQGLIIEPDSVDPQKIIVRLDSAYKELLASPCDQFATGQSCGVPPMRSINKVCPDDDGKITLRFE